jgi:hypothetical protein
MTQAIEPKRLKDLIRLLGQLQQLHEDLATIVKEKVEAMRRADMPTLQKQGERERRLVQRIQQREGLRHQLMDAIGEQLGLPPRAARALTVSQLVGKLPSAQRKGIPEAADHLRTAVSKVARANRVAGMVARELVDHLRRVFAAVRPKSDGDGGYTGHGAATARCENRIFEAVG